MFKTLLSHFTISFYSMGLCIVAAGLGKIITKKLAINFASVTEDFFYTAGLGFGIIGYAVFILASAGILYPRPIIILFIVLIVLAISGWYGFHWKLKNINTKPRRPLKIITCGIIAIFLLIGLLLIFTPEISRDALSYHLAVPKLYLNYHGFHFIPGNIFSNYPLLTEMIYVLALFFSGDILAKAIHFAAFIFIIAGLYSFARFRMTYIDFPELAVLIFATIPTVFLISYLAYVDLFTAYYVIAAVFTFIIWSDEKDKGWLVLCALFSGLACATKYTVLLLPLVGCLGILWIHRGQHASAKNAIKNVFVYAIIVIVAGIPFYVKNYILTGNPFYPFFYNLFGGRGWDANQARYYDLFISTLGMGKGLLDYFLLPWNLSFRAEFDSLKFDGILGPIFFLTIPLALGLRKTEKAVKIIAIYCTIMFLFWAATAQQMRYLIPLFPLLSICVASIWTQYKSKKIVLGIMSLFISVSLAYNWIYIAKEINRIKPFGVALGLETRDDYLKRQIPSYGMFRYINQNLPDDSYVLMIFMKNYGYLCDHNYYSDSMFESYKLQKLLSSSLSPADAIDNIKKEGFTHLLLDKRFIYSPLSTFSQQEKEMFQALEVKYFQMVYNEGNYYLFFISNHR